MNTRRFSVPARFNRGAYGSEEESIASAVWLLHHMCEHVGVADLSATEVLDYGCGVEFTQAILEHDVPVKRYVGVDLYTKMIEFLRESVDDPRFEYHSIDVHNALYNPTGPPMTATTELPVGDRQFDLICLFSVFTHLAPDDYRVLLQFLRRYVRPDGRLFFTLFVNEQTAGGHGLVDVWARGLAQYPELIAAADSTPNGNAGPPPGFVDLDPSRPLLLAVYSEEHARELIAGTGWEVLELSAPEPYIQHHFVCAPC